MAWEESGGKVKEEAWKRNSGGMRKGMREWRRS